MKLASEGIRGGMGVSVVWNPPLNRYYAAVSGTGEKWLIIYNQQGKPIKKPYSLPFDPGSLWLEGSGKALKSYASGMEGLYVIHLREGLPAYFENIFHSLHNPVAIGNGAWARHRREMWYYHDKTIFRYKTKHAHHRPPLNLNIDDFENELNSMGLIYTGIKNREITDGLSKTVLVMERASTAEPSGLVNCGGSRCTPAPGRWAGALIESDTSWNAGYSAGVGETYGGWNPTNAAERGYWLGRATWTWAGSYINSSKHPGMAQAVFCDGAVRSVSETVADRVWDAIRHRRDGAPVNLDAL